MHHFLRIKISQENEEIFILQKKYTKSLLKKFKMIGCKVIATPLMTNGKLQNADGYKKEDTSTFKSLIKRLLYLTTIRLDIIYATSLLSRFMQSPSEIHFRAIKRRLRQL